MRAGSTTQQCALLWAPYGPHLSIPCHMCPQRSFRARSKRIKRSQETQFDPNFLQKLSIIIKHHLHASAEWLDKKMKQWDFPKSQWGPQKINCLGCDSLYTFCLHVWNFAKCFRFSELNDWKILRPLQDLLLRFLESIPIEVDWNITSVYP